jgi:serine/threonine protein phosphatase 1
MRYVIPDIHGCAETLRSMLWDTLEINEKDIVYFLGDYIDRGPSSKLVLDLIMDAIKDGYDFRPTKGNHDDWLLQQYDEKFTDAVWQTWGGDETLESFGVRSVTEIPWYYIKFLRKLPNVIVEDDWVFSHAGLNFNRANPIEDATENDLLWNRVQGHPTKKQIGGRRSCMGHSPENLPTIKFHVKQGSCRLTLDNCVYDTTKDPEYGNLCCYCIDTNELHSIRRIDEVTWEPPKVKWKKAGWSTME